MNCDKEGKSLSDFSKEERRKKSLKEVRDIEYLRHKEEDDDPSHAIIKIAEEEAERICNSINTELIFSASQKRYAVSILKYKSVVVSIAEFEHLKEIAKKSTEIFASRMMEQEKKIQAKTKIFNSKNDVFKEFLLSLFIFVIFHEISHLLHRHGLRTDASSNQVKKSKDSEQSNENNDFDSQAREFVADAMAYALFWGWLTGNPNRSKNLHQILCNHDAGFGKLKINALDISYFIPSLYFATIDLKKITDNDQAAKTHPPRWLRFLYILAGSNKSGKINRITNCNERVTNIYSNIHTIICKFLPKEKYNDWILENKKDYSNQFKKIKELAPKWNLFYDSSLLSTKSNQSLTTSPAQPETIFKS